MEITMNENIYYSVEDVTEDIKKNFGWRIQEKRLEKGITGADLGACLNISANQISRIERGCAGLDMVKLLVLCKVLGVSSDYILYGTIDNEENVVITKKHFESIMGLIGAFGKEN